MNLSKPFRVIALVEATSFLALLIATAVKYGADNEAGVKILGPVHGMLFLIYVALAVLIRSERGWSVLTTLVVLVAAVLPFGGYFVDRWMSKTDLVTGTSENRR